MRKLVKTKTRTLDETGRASDGKPINPGDTFRTLSIRDTSAYPKQQRLKYASQWLIDNAVAEAESHGDDFNAKSFGAEKPGRDGGLTAIASESMLMYLFGCQSAIPRKMLH